MTSTHDYVITKEVLSLADVEIEQFCMVKACSDEQKNFANDLKVQALATIWRAIKPEVKTAKFANAVVQAFRLHQDARFWIDNKSQFNYPNSTMALFSKDIKAALEA